MTEPGDGDESDGSTADDAPSDRATEIPADLAALRREVHRLRHRLTRAEDQVAHLRRAVATNRRIGIAVGVLMASHHLTVEQAFDALRQASNRENQKLRDVAERVIYTGRV